MGFDREKACSLAGEALKLVSSYYPTGALEWLAKHRTDIVGHLKAAEASVDAAILTDNAVAFRAALEQFVKRHVRAFEVYTSRPQPVEHQADLFPRAPHADRLAA